MTPTIMALAGVSGFGANYKSMMVRISKVDDMEYGDIETLAKQTECEKWAIYAAKEA